jgi:hypothetical protein
MEVEDDRRGRRHGVGLDVDGDPDDLGRDRAARPLREVRLVSVGELSECRRGTEMFALCGRYWVATSGLLGATMIVLLP